MAHQTMLHIVDPALEDEASRGGAAIASLILAVQIMQETVAQSSTKVLHTFLKA